MSFQQFAFIRCGLSLAVSHSCSWRGLLSLSLCWSSVSCPWSLSPSICIIFGNTNKVELDHYKNIYGKDTGKIMTTPRWSYRQGCKKHLKFIPGIVTAFQSGLGQNYFFVQKEYNRRGRRMIKQSQMNKFILCSVKSYIPIFLKSTVNSQARSQREPFEIPKIEEQKQKQVANNLGARTKLQTGGPFRLVSVVY